MSNQNKRYEELRCTYLPSTFYEWVNAFKQIHSLKVLKIITTEGLEAVTFHDGRYFVGNDYFSRVLTTFPTSTLQTCYFTASLKHIMQCENYWAPGSERKNPEIRQQPKISAALFLNHQWQHVCIATQNHTRSSWLCVHIASHGNSQRFAKNLHIPGQSYRFAVPLSEMHPQCSHRRIYCIAQTKQRWRWIFNAMHLHNALLKLCKIWKLTPA